MEAIDDYANENIVRSVAYTALDHRQQHHYLGLLPISSQLLRQRVRLLGPNENNPEEWDKVVQWQDDNCPSMIESLWSNQGSVADELYQKPVYYKRMDADTLHAIIEFAEKDSHHFVVILLLEDGVGDISDIKYYNTKELTEEEWLDIFTNWSRTIEDAERIFLTKVTRNKKTFTAGTPDVSCKSYGRDLYLRKKYRAPKRAKKLQRIIGVIGRLMKDHAVVKNQAILVGHILLVLI